METQGKKKLLLKKKYWLNFAGQDWGNRTSLELAEQARLENFMAHDAVQDLLDKESW